MVASGPVAALAGLSLLLIARVEEKYLPHHSLRKFLELRGMAGFADFAANISRRRRFAGFGLRGRSNMRRSHQHSADKTAEQKAPPISSHFLKTV